LSEFGEKLTRYPKIRFKILPILAPEENRGKQKKIEIDLTL
jgi:hypothetical protein